MSTLTLVDKQFGDNVGIHANTNTNTNGLLTTEFVRTDMSNQ